MITMPLSKGDQRGGSREVGAATMGQRLTKRTRHTRYAVPVDGSAAAPSCVTRVAPM